MATWGSARRWCRVVARSRSARRQARSVAGPLVLGDRANEETLLVALADRGVHAPLQRDDIGQTTFKRGPSPPGSPAPSGTGRRTAAGSQDPL
jgi:hypothetical protein